MADFEEKMPSGLWGTIVFLFVEIILIVCLVPNAFIDKSILKEQEWGEILMGKDSHDLLIENTNSLYTDLMLNSGVNETVKFFFIPTAEERERSKGWENLGDLWFSFISARGEALTKVIYHIYYRMLLLFMWAPYMVVMLVPSIFGGYMTWHKKRYSFAHSSPFLNTHSSRLIWFSVIGVMVSFIAPLPIPPLIIPLIVILLIPIASTLLIGNLPKRL